jgi:hypothetical protein
MAEIVPFLGNPSGEVYIPGSCPALMEWREVLRDIQIGALEAVEEGNMTPADYIARFGMPPESLPSIDSSGLRMARSLELSTAGLYFGAAPVPGEDVVETSVFFARDPDSWEDDPQGLTTFALPLPDVPVESAAGHAALALDHEVQGQDVTDRRNQLRQILCDKKRACPGPGETGECPVFGPQGFFRTLAEIMGEHETGAS